MNLIFSLDIRTWLVVRDCLLVVDPTWVIEKNKLDVKKSREVLAQQKTKVDDKEKGKKSSSSQENCKPQGGCHRKNMKPYLTF